MYSKESDITSSEMFLLFDLSPPPGCGLGFTSLPVEACDVYVDLRKPHSYYKISLCYSDNRLFCLWYLAILSHNKVAYYSYNIMWLRILMYVHLNS